MPHAFPHRYQMSLKRGAPGAAMLDTEFAQSIQGGAPVQFDGAPGTWSPETLLLSSVSLCLMTTFESLARRDALTYSGYQAEIEGVLDKTTQGLVFTDIHIQVKIQAEPTVRPAIEVVFQKAKKHCIISNALKVEVRASLGWD